MMRKTKRRSRCPSAEKLIAFVCEEAAQATRQRIEAHLEQCPLCRDEVEEIQEFLQGDLAEEVAEAYRDVNSLEALPVPEGLSGGLIAKDPPALGRKGNGLAETGKKSGRKGGNSMGLFDFFRKRKLIATATALMDGSKKAYVHSDYSRALSYLHQALDIFRQLGHQEGIANCLSNIGNIYGVQGAYSQTLGYFEQALDIMHQLDDKEGVAGCLNNIGRIWEARREFLVALSYYSEALGIARQLGHQKQIAICLTNIGNLDYLHHDYSWALDVYQQALDIFRQLGHQEGIAACLNNIGAICEVQGDYPQALSSYLQTLGIIYELGNWAEAARCLSNMGYAYLQQKDRRHAYYSLEQAIAIVEMMRYKVAGGRQQQIVFFDHFLDPYFSFIEGVLWPQKDHGQALEYVERAKARTLVELLAEQDLLPAGNVPSELVQEYKQLRQRQREIEFWLEQEGSWQEQKAADLRAEWQEVTEEVSSLLEKIREHEFRTSKKYLTFSRTIV